MELLRGIISLALIYVAFLIHLAIAMWVIKELALFVGMQDLFQ